MKHFLVFIFLFISIGLFAQTKAVGHIFAEVVESIENSVDSSFLIKNELFVRNDLFITSNVFPVKTINIIRIDPFLKPDNIIYTIIINYN